MTFVEHPGNAGRPHAAVNRPIASLHRPSGWSRSYVLASLRALHLDQRLRPGALRAKRALTSGLTQETTRGPVEGRALGPLRVRHNNDFQPAVDTSSLG